MPGFGKTSIENLRTCDERLQQVFNHAIKIIDCTIIEGHREKEKQDRYFAEGKSKVNFPDGKHNKTPSQALDACPWVNGSLSWDTRHCIYLAGIVTGVAEMMGIKIRWGGDWDMDREPITDQEFQDLVHFELVDYQ